jgi:cyanophycinase
MTKAVSAISQCKPIYLLADSQLLFWDSDANRFLTSIRENLKAEQSTVTKAAYVGASNGDQLEFFDLFVAAMDNINTHQSRMILSEYSDDDREFMVSADLIVLAGGDFSKGWDVMETTGMSDAIRNRYLSGAVLVGVSAGAMQLGMGGFKSESGEKFVDTLKLVPHYISVHEENDWPKIKRTVVKQNDYAKGLGIASGGGLICHPDFVIEPIRKTVTEFFKSSQDDEAISSNILMPPEIEEAASSE